MKRIFSTVTMLLVMAATAFAQRFQVGFRVGANVADITIPRVELNEEYIVGGKARIGFETALMARLEIIHRLHLQAEFEFSRLGYQLRYVHPEYERLVKLYANRVEIPLMLGVDVGPMRLFAGLYFRIAHSEKSNAPSVAKVGFNDSDIGVMGGVGLNIRRFFIEARLSGYPKSYVTSTIEANGHKQRVRIHRNIRYSISTGIYF
ncbi:MAG: PorT family protein [Alistipes sp.]|nr:PorT family protein [Alistipes sp.]